eukprot:COSAG02_NODE_64270_length_261_cov_0.617284_1_plen_73_part_10
MAKRNEGCVEFFLDNYVEAAGSVLGKSWASSRLITQNVVADVLRTFPTIGAAFITSLSLSDTNLLSRNSRCKL